MWDVVGLGQWSGEERLTMKSMREWMGIDEIDVRVSVELKPVNVKKCWDNVSAI